MHKAKVLCIGLNKTPTSSLEATLELIGYRVYGTDYATSTREAKRKAKSKLERWDALQDVPWPVLYK